MCGRPRASVGLEDPVVRMPGNDNPLGPWGGILGYFPGVYSRLLPYNRSSSGGYLVFVGTVSCHRCCRSPSPVGVIPTPCTVGLVSPNT